jgi:NADPH-dependent curcumin reductase CurA
MRGFLVTQFLPKFPSALLLLTALVKSGKLIQAIDMQEGFDQIPGTLTRLFTGANVGKQLLKVSDPLLPVPSNPLMGPALAIAQKVRGMFKI